MSALAQEMALVRAAPSDPIPVNESLIVALDVPTIDIAKQIVDEFGDLVNFYKIGMQLQFAGGLDLAKTLVEHGKKVFLDSKLLDIDQTISSAVENVAKMGVTFLTVHGIGDTISAAIKGRGDSDLKILAVTVLTHVDQDYLTNLGIKIPLEKLVIRLAGMALDAGADGVLASGLEVNEIRKRFGNQLTVVTPGIRPTCTDIHDQRRVTTPAHAIRAGADYLVVGRPILQAANRCDAVRKILREIELSRQESIQPLISMLAT
ncbi:MAG: orotidine-5'-phosphate decarboxylase [Pseudomonadota bacterium]|nr:orotidine-5'-phosphate decarboxylase [Pseudomonadota bacterium]